MNSRLAKKVYCYTMSWMSITAAILALLGHGEWARMTPRQINGGRCEDFQREAIDAACLDAYLAERCTENYIEDPNLPGHCWIEHDGRHYDSETPHGVADWRDLPIFVRWRARQAATAA